MWKSVDLHRVVTERIPAERDVIEPNRLRDIR